MRKETDMLDRTKFPEIRLAEELRDTPWRSRINAALHVIETGNDVEAIGALQILLKVRTAVEALAKYAGTESK
jgi:hypothetical protein